MNRNLGSDRPFPSSLSAGGNSWGASDILNHLTGIEIPRALGSDFSKAFEICEFQLGEDLLNYPLPETGGEAGGSDFYLVCEGRVRLLVFDAQRDREIPAMVLEAGDTFGADGLFCKHILPYRAIAASSGRYARISPSKLQPFLQRLPQLQERLQQQSAGRFCQIFFKTHTELRSLPSHQLVQLLPYFVEKTIPQGSKLSEIASTCSGRFWLRSGEIIKQQTHSSIAAAGTSWGYPQTTAKDWIAQTELQVYHLAAERWLDAIAIAPTLAAMFGESLEINGGKRVARAQPHKGKAILESARSQPKTEAVKESLQKPESEEIAFPKPIRRRFLDFLWRYPFIEQQSSSDCGAACLATIGLYWGKRFSINTLRELAGVGRNGANLQALAKAAESLGFHAKPVRASLNKLCDRNMPWIAHWQGIHYIVVYHCKGNRILVADPAVGKRYVPKGEFLENWSGYALLLDPTARLKTVESEKLSLARYAIAMKPYKGAILQIVFASLLIQIFGVLTPLFTQIILDEVVQSESFTTLHVFALGAVLFGIWSVALTGIRQYLLDYFSNRLDLTLISGFVSHTLLLPLKFFESRRVGDIVTRVQENQKIQRFLVGQVVLAWLDVLTGAIYLALMFYYNWRLTVLVLALIPPIALLTLVATPFMRRVSKDIFNESADQNSLLVEMLTGVTTVKAAAAEREIRWRWEDAFISSLNARFRGQKLANTLQVISGAINTIGSTALLWYGAALVIQKQLTIGQFVAFNMTIGKVIGPFLTLVRLWDELQEVLISVERLNDVFDAKPEESPGNPMLVLPSVRGEVRFENVTFRYDQYQERNTLQNISFEVGAGQTVAIVGRSGSGKSTLVNLLQGLYKPESGRISIDGHDLRLISPSSLRAQLGVVPQECFLFSGTILENITLYRPEYSLGQVTEVCKLAEAHGFIQDMPLGYNTKVGERGSMLSGGQRQRIAIARALLGNPRILVLDEATSSLDTESERRFQANLERFARDRTTFIIAHRLSTVRNAHCILVLDRGILVETGTHSQLMELQGLYYNLAQQQLDL